ncbi:hypothetical protein [Cellulomonas oligotrophica]|uniref:Uncharacterized protein n=1 Tax=Cellulomonas oligotrophica TaxID=931536 RepID=A0A7Y9FFG1_9CELL|nr:hypothetical protein [Cellulomonas oligotrophica]NYD85051.1 hypothetical protein [Cellulomonas oligotrophica]GIG33756.1 hypothetical protein Col01nite_29150 [Cellulomonas oligotrophica]
MRLLPRRDRLPDDVRRGLDLGGDAVLAAAPLSPAGWVVASRRALHLVRDDAPRARTAWADVDHGSLDAQTRTLTVRWVSGARTDLVLADDSRASRDLAQVFRERVQQSVVHVVHVPVDDREKVVVRVALRRAEDGTLFTQTLGAGTVDLDDPGVRRAVEAGEGRVREEAGLR